MLGRNHYEKLKYEDILRFSLNHKQYGVQNIIRIVKSRRLRWKDFFRKDQTVKSLIGKTGEMINLENQGLEGEEYIEVNSRQTGGIVLQLSQ